MIRRLAVLHGVNLDRLGRRDPLIYGDFTLLELEAGVKAFGHEAGFGEVVFFQTNHEGEMVEELHRSSEVADCLLVNAGAWTHYSYGIRDALESSGLPFAEVHLSDVGSREPWRQHSVFADLPTRVTEVHGKGPDGYREAILELAGSLEA